MSNADMKANRFLYAMNSKRAVEKITNHLNAGGSVVIATYGKAIQYKPKHASMFRASKSENGFYTQSGKRWLFNRLGSVAIRFA